MTPPDPALLPAHILDVLHEGVIVQDGAGRIVAWNASALRMLGAAAEGDGAGPPLAEVWTSMASADWPATAPGHPADVARSTGRPQLEVVIEAETGRGEHRSFRLNAIPLPASQGRGTGPSGVVSTFIDVTEPRRARERFRSLLEFAPDAMVVAAPSGEILMVNAATEQLFGYGRNELEGALVDTLVPGTTGHDAGPRTDLLRELPPTSRGPGGTVLAGRRRDGSEVPVEVSSATVSIDGTPMLYAAIRDVSARLSAERDLNEMRERFRLAQQQSPVGLALVSTEGRWLDVNPALCRIIGRSAEELRGMTFADTTHPDDLEADLTQLASLRRGAIDSYELEKRLLRPDGEVVWVRLHRSVVREVDGTARYYLSQLQDITERKRTQEILDVFFAASPDLLCLTDLEGRFARVSPSWARAVGWAEEELVGRSLLELAHAEDLDSVGSGLTRRSGEGAGRFEGRFRSRDGSWRWVEWSVQPLPELGLLVCNGRDTTATKAQAELLERSRRELERSNRELTQFASVASHDLSEPLRAINGFSSLLSSELGDELSPDAQTYLDFILDGTRRMRALIDALLAYARVGRNRQPSTEVDLDALVHDLLSSTLASDGATVAVVGTLGTVVVDATQVSQLLQNLLTNALKFRSGEDHRVEVSAVRVQGWVELCIDDNGVGIDPADRERVFEMFQRLHTRDEFPGSGIGLAICARIAEQHGGSIRVEGSPLGGARFVVTLPLAPDRPS